MRLRIAPRPIVYGLASLLAGGALSVAGAAIIFNGPLGGTAANAASPAIFCRHRDLRFALYIPPRRSLSLGS